MAYQALYRKWRPLTFDDVIGQSHITQTLVNEIVHNRIAHAYLFCGTRGTGKTSTAKIFSRAINCLNNHNGNPCNECEICKGILDGSNMDVVEIDAASNNGVDNIREIRDEVAYAPSKSKYKVYIIDEVHMLSSGAFNALLKTLEEPPSHVIFILATTESHKIPATILSRCQRFDFKRISTDDVVNRLKQIIQKDHINIDDKGLRLIARVSDGSMRDALSILDQCIAFGEQTITYEDIATTLGIVDNVFLFEITDSILSKDTGKVMEHVEKLVMDGRDIVNFIEDLTLHFRNLLMCKVVGQPENVLDMSSEAIEQLKKQSITISQEKIVHCIKVLSEAHANAKWSSNPRIVLEVALMKICQPVLDTSTEALMDRIAELEHKLTAGAVVVTQEVSQERKVFDQNNVTQETKPEPIPDKADCVEQEVEQAEVQNDSELNEIINMWPEVVETIKKSGKPILYGHLVDVYVESVDGVLGIIFKDSCSMNKMMVSRKENIEFIEETILKLSGTPVKVKCFLEKEIKNRQEDDKEDKFQQLMKLKDELGDIVQIYDE